MNDVNVHRFLNLKVASQYITSSFDEDRRNFRDFTFRIVSKYLDCCWIITTILETFYPPPVR